MNAREGVKLWWSYPEHHPDAKTWCEAETIEEAVLHEAQGWANGGMSDFVLVVEDNELRTPRRFKINVTVTAKELTEENT